MKTTLTLLLLSPLYLFNSKSALAEVNMKDAGYYKTWVDLEIPKAQRVFQLRRTYHSRSLHQGFFGFGWCSDFEKKLYLNRSDQITLNDCRLTAPIRYKKKRQNLYESPEKETLEYKDQHYFRITSQKTLQKYNKLGQLVSLIDPSQKNQNSILDLTYDTRGFLKKIVILGTSEILVETDSQRRHILSLKTSNQAGVFYRYSGKDLIQVTNSWKNIFTYQYDELHNLTQIKYPDLTSETLTYDKKRDWILSIQNRQKCLELFDYASDEKSGISISTAEKRCAGKMINKTSYEFRHKTRADGTKYLDEVKITQGKKTQRISYQNKQRPLDDSQ